MSDAQRGSAPRNVVVAGGVLSFVAVAAIGGALYLRSRPTEPEPAPAASAPPPAPAPAPAPEAAPEPKVEAPAPPPVTITESSPRKASPRRTPVEPPPVLAAKSPVRAALSIDTDVPGASVFIDRQFVGNTPLQLERLEPGQRTVNVSAEGFSTITQSLNLAAGENTLTLRFKEVKLDTNIGVVHKHGVGSCEGTLQATVDGLSYVTSNKGDAFAMGFTLLETFSIDYMEKNLRVKQRNGKTWNFTVKTGTADPLFVFHREVDAAKKKLAEGYTPVK